MFEAYGYPFLSNASYPTAPTQVMVNAVEYGINALPFGAPVAAIIGCIYSRAAQVRQWAS